MNLPSCYNKKHTAALNKISARLVEGKEFILAYDENKSVPENSKDAYINRWYGNCTERKCNELTRHFAQRYYISKENFDSLRLYLSIIDGNDFSWLNHFYMLLNDPYYRWATTTFMSERYNCGLLEIPRSKFDQELKKQLPDTIGDGSLARYGQNLLTAIRDNGLLEGVSKKYICSPGISLNTLAFMLFSLSDMGVGVNEFDGSPLFISLLKPRELMVPLFLQGEREGFWDFTGDKEKLKLNLHKNSLKDWLMEVV